MLLEHQQYNYVIDLEKGAHDPHSNTFTTSFKMNQQCFGNTLTKILKKDLFNIPSL